MELDIGSCGVTTRKQVTNKEKRDNGKKGACTKSNTKIYMVELPQGRW